MNEAILIDCEGAGYLTHDPDAIDGMCAMCGRYVPVDRNAKAKPHKRDDILARIERGDFG